MSTDTGPQQQQQQQQQQQSVLAPLPRVAIQFCTQCKWMLRAAYFAQELLSTFSLSLGEVALQPSTGGTFIVTIHHLQQPPLSSSSYSSSSSPATAVPTGQETVTISSTILWDRKIDGGFPETKELKRRVRDVIEPGRNLGHVDRDHHRPATSTASTAPNSDQQHKEKEGGGEKIDPAPQQAAAAIAADKSKCEDCN